MFLCGPDVKVWPSELRCPSCEQSSSSHVTLCRCQAAKCSMETVASGPVLSQRSPAFDPVWAAEYIDSPNSPLLPPPLPAWLNIKISSLNNFFLPVLFCVPSCHPCHLVIFGFRLNAKQLCGPSCFFQVSYIYALAVFEDYLYATQSDPSKGTSSVELLQIHRFNITAESRTLASLGNTQRLRLYHRLTQPKGKGHFLYGLTCQLYVRIFPTLWLINRSVGELRERMLRWLKVIPCPLQFHPQAGVMHAKRIHMEDQVDAPTSASWVAATSPEAAAVVLATAWALMDSPVKVSFYFSSGCKYSCRKC